MRIFNICKSKQGIYSTKRIIGVYLGIIGGIEKMILFFTYLIHNKVNIENFDRLDSSANWLITFCLGALGSTLFEKKPTITQIDNSHESKR